jgi:uncharacterized protein
MILKKIILIILGSISLVIGVIGIFVPGLPTTVFLLITAALYMRSSDKLYQKLLANKILGPYITDFQVNKGMTRRTKLHAIGTMWFMIAVSSFFLIEPLNIKLIVITLGIIGTIVMGFIVRTIDKKEPGKE